MICPEAVAAHIRSAGRRGLSISDIHLFMTGVVPSDRRQRGAVHAVLDRVSKIACIDVIEPRTPRVRYVIGAASAAPAAMATRVARDPSISSVTRLVSGEIGMGSTPGAPVSVAYLSCLDAPPRARDGEGR